MYNLFQLREDLFKFPVIRMPYLMIKIFIAQIQIKELHVLYMSNEGMDIY